MVCSWFVWIFKVNAASWCRYTGDACVHCVFMKTLPTALPRSDINLDAVSAWHPELELLDPAHGEGHACQNVNHLLFVRKDKQAQAMEFYSLGEGNQSCVAMAEMQALTGQCGSCFCSYHCIIVAHSNVRPSGWNRDVV